MESPRYRKWQKRIRNMVDKKKLDLKDLQQAIIASGSFRIDSTADEYAEPDIADTIDNWI